ncbi:MAG: hypothetical protein KC994_10900 [Candidatus Omnitrophica bacterium]|nr:hypothetical protein [Candidatus Omnitrophota bacterium]
MKTTTEFQKFIQRIIERATDPSPDRYLDHVRVRNFGRPNLGRIQPTQNCAGRENGESCSNVSPAEGFVFGK